MRISVLINGKAGRANAAAIRTVVDRALFRADIAYFEPSSVEELQLMTLVQAKTSEALIICGGDGTLNTAIQPLLSELMKSNSKFVIPPILPLPVGTANDLASELGVSRRLERAARLVFETKPKSIDVIEVKSGEKTVYMLTNGGIGIAAETANLANEVRETISRRTDDGALSRLGRGAVSLAGSRIYEILLAGQLLSGHSSKWLEGWSLSIEIDGGIIRETTAPFVMVNNQPGLGGKYVPAPLTSNTDGTFNILLVDTPNIFSQARALLKIRAGEIPDERTCPRLETRRAIFRAHPSCRDLTFFGDGEILQSGVREIELTCLKRALPVYVGGES
jgi:diacylglycerol kinase family enzyme